MIYQCNTQSAFQSYFLGVHSFLILTVIGESSFNMTRGGGGGEDIEGGLQKFLDTRRGGSEKIVALGGGDLKICILH